MKISKYLSLFVGLVMFSSACAAEISEESTNDDNSSEETSESETTEGSNGEAGDSKTVNTKTPDSDFAYFNTPSKNIWCNSPSDNTTVCSISDYDFEPVYVSHPDDREECDLDWEGLFFLDDNSVSSGCVSDTSYLTTRDGKTLRADIAEDDIPVLEYGKTNEFDGVTCSSEESGLTCTNANGQGIMISKAKVEYIGETVDSEANDVIQAARKLVTDSERSAGVVKQVEFSTGTSSSDLEGSIDPSGADIYYVEVANNDQKLEASVSSTDDAAVLSVIDADGELLTGDPKKSASTSVDKGYYAVVVEAGVLRVGTEYELELSIK